jgi:hypothetical protein
MRTSRERQQRELVEATRLLRAADRREGEVAVWPDHLRLSDLGKDLIASPASGKICNLIHIVQG